MTTGAATLLGKYELQERIGLGGMAEVYRARLPSVHGLHKVVAIKRILPYHCADDNFIQMFLDEARIALALNHPNIGQIYELDAVDDVYFLAMEYIDGPNLSLVIKRLRKTKHRIPLELVLCIMRQVCAGLHAAHTQLDDAGQPMQIIHRDVSPHNVMVSRSGGVKLIDFGIAKARDRLVKTETGTVRGKLLYMSPEHAASRQLDHRTDIFSAGMLLLTFLNGQHIWRGQDEVEVLVKLRSWQPPDMRALRPDLPAAVHQQLQEIVQRSMAFNPDDRFPDAEHMRRALARLQALVNPETSVLTLGYFVNEVLHGRLEMAEAVEENTNLIIAEQFEHTRQTPSQRKLPNIAAVPPPNEVTVTQGTHMSPNDTPTPNPHNTAVGMLTGQRRADTVRSPVPAYIQPEPGDLTPINGIQLAPGIHSDGHHVPDDPITRDTQYEEDPTENLDPDILTAVALTLPSPEEIAQRPDLNAQRADLTVQSALPSQPLQTPLPSPTAAPNRMPLILIGIALGLISVVLLALLTAKVVFDNPEAPPGQTAKAPATGDELNEGKGTAIIHSTPAGASISIDGKPTGMVTPSRLALAAGEHELTLTAGDHETYTQSIAVIEREEHSFSIHLSPENKAPVDKNRVGDQPLAKDTVPSEDLEQSPTLVLYSNPAATVFIDGDQLPDPARPDNPLEITPLTLGQTYKIRIQKRGYESMLQEVKVDKPRVEIRAELTRQTHGYLTITSNLWAEVYIDGRKVANSTPLKLYRIKAGSHAVTLKNPEKQLTRTVRVNVLPGGKLTYPVRF